MSLRLSRTRFRGWFRWHCLWRGRRRRLVSLWRAESWRQARRFRLLLGWLHRVVVRHLHVRTSNDVVEHLLGLLLFDGGLGTIARALRRSKWVCACIADQNVTRMHLLFRFAVFRLGLSLFELDNVKTKLALDYVTDLAWLQSVSSLLKLGNHLAMS